MEIKAGMKKGAIISDCGRYRYQLWRIWDETKPKVLFIMHNPSKANGLDDDPTIRRCIGFAKSWNYGGIYVGNEFPYRSTKPDVLKKLPFEEIAPAENIGHIKEMIKMCQMHILAYGNLAVPYRGIRYVDPYWHYLRLTKQGHPGHPLFLPKNLTPQKFTHKDIPIT